MASSARRLVFANVNRSFNNKMVSGVSVTAVVACLLFGATDRQMSGRLVEFSGPHDPSRADGWRNKAIQRKGSTVLLIETLGWSFESSLPWRSLLSQQPYGIMILASTLQEFLPCFFYTVHSHTYCQKMRTSLRKANHNPEIIAVIFSIRSKPTYYVCKRYL